MSTASTQMFPCIERYKASIGAGGLYCTGTTEIDGKLTLNDGLTVDSGGAIIHGDITLGETSSDNLLVKSQTQFDSAIYAYGNATLGNNSTSDTLTVAAIQNYSGAETHAGAVTLNSGLTVHMGGAIVHGDITLGETSSDNMAVNAQAEFNSATSFNADMVLGNADTDVIDCQGRLKTLVEIPRTLVTVDANLTITALAYRCYVFTITAGRVFNINLASTPTVDTMITIYTNSATHALTVNIGGALLGYVGGGTYLRRADLSYQSGGWMLLNV
jgi:hypothetical protein